MPLWQWVLDVVGVLVVLIALFAVALVVRRRMLSRNGGTFELSYRARPERAGRGWVLGLGRYAGEDLQWFRIFSLSPRPQAVWQRSRLTLQGRREAHGHEQMSLYADHVIVVLHDRGQEIELAMNAKTMMGFQSWVESAPPGTDWDRHRHS